MLTLPNYQIGNQIYESVNSLIYRGHRKKDNQLVILKMLKQDYPTPAELTRYQQEYEITHDFELAHARHHFGRFWWRVLKTINGKPSINGKGVFAYCHPNR